MTRAVDVASRGVRVSGRSVGVGTVILDSEVLWTASEGSGTTLGDTGGAGLSADITLDLDAWVSDSKYVGGSAVDCQNNDQFGTTASRIAAVSKDSAFTIEVWFEADSQGGSDRGQLALQETTGDIFSLGFSTDNDILVGGFYDGANRLREVGVDAPLDGSLNQIVWGHNGTDNSRAWLNTNEETADGRIGFKGDDVDEFRYAGEASADANWDGVIDRMQIIPQTPTQSLVDDLHADHPST